MRLITKRDKVNSGLLNMLILVGVSLLTFGYYISASIAILTNIPSRPVNIVYRAIATLSLFIPALYILRKKKKPSRTEIGLWVFWIIYILRLIIDIFFRDITYNNTSNTGITIPFIFILLIFNILLPCFVVFSFKEYINFNKLSQWLTFTILISNILVFYSVLSSHQYLVQDEASRFSLGAEGSSTLNPISISLIGSVTIVSAIYWMIFKRQSIVKRLLYLIMIGMGIFNLMIGGSRGPFSATLIALMFVAYYYVKYKQSIGRYLKFIIFGFIFILGFLTFFVQRMDNILIFERVNETLKNYESGRKEERNELFSIALEMFLEKPVFGYQFVTSSTDPSVDRVIPHNIFLESLMATGILGSIFLFPILMRQVRIFFTLFKYPIEETFIIILSIIFFIQSLISGAIFLSVEYFSLLYLCLVLKNRYDNKYPENKF